MQADSLPAELQGKPSVIEVGFKPSGAGSRDHVLTQDAPGEKPSVMLRLTVLEEVGYPLQYSWASLVAQLVKNLPAMQESC